MPHRLRSFLSKKKELVASEEDFSITKLGPLKESKESGIWNLKKLESGTPKMARNGPPEPPKVNTAGTTQNWHRTHATESAKRNLAGRKWNP